MLGDFFEIEGNDVSEYIETKDEKVSKIGLFDYLNSINLPNSKYLETDTTYSPFMVNRAFMQYQDTLYISNALSKLNITDKQAHYDYLFYSVPKRKRFSKWAKETKHNFEDIIEMIQDKYCYNRKHAISFYNSIDDEEIEMIKREYVFGI